MPVMKHSSEFYKFRVHITLQTSISLTSMNQKTAQELATILSLAVLQNKLLFKQRHIWQSF